jgi:hypothetical protein
MELDGEERLRRLLHRVKAWALDVEDAIEEIRDLCEGVKPTTPPDTGTTLLGPPLAAIAQGFRKVEAWVIDL